MSNLSEEEKKAIEYLSLKAITSSIEVPDYQNCIVMKKDLQIILNLIEKQDKIIKQQSYTNKKIRNKLKTVRKERNKQQKELEKKDKIIDVKQTSDEFTNETRYYTPEGEIYETIIETYKCPKNYISKDKIREKIKELEKQMEKDEVDDFGIHSIGWSALDYIVECLKSLLQEGDK